MAVLTGLTKLQAEAIADPKLILHKIDEYVVYTEGDIPKNNREITITEFRSRFTDDEIDAINTLAYGGTGDAPTRRLLLKIQTRSYIDLDDPQVIVGMGYLVSQGIMTQVRAYEILF